MWDETMKIKVKEMSYEDVLALPKEKRFSPIRPSIIFRSLLKAVSAGELKDVGFTFAENGMEKLKGDELCLILMNHSAFIDLKIAVTYFFPRPMNPRMDSLAKSGLCVIWDASPQGSLSPIWAL